MSDAGSSPLPPTAPRRLFTREEWDHAAEVGLFPPDERLELIAGEVIRKMTPQSVGHARAITLAEEQLRKAFPGRWIRVQMPLALGPHDEPEPDIAVVEGSAKDAASSHPTFAVLVVEVADSSLAFDRSVKGSLYARAGIPEYWIVNLRDRVLEVHTEPAPMADQPLGHHYRSVSRHTERDAVAPGAASGAPIAIRELLP